MSVKYYEMPKDRWTPERIAALLRLRDQGLSASQISDELPGGFSRNAVIGKLTRMGLRLGNSVCVKAERKPIPQLLERARSAEIKIKARHEYKRQSAVWRETIQEPRYESFTGILEVSGKQFPPEHDECREIIGEPKNLKCCGQKVFRHYPYCEPHSRKNFLAFKE